MSAPYDYAAKGREDFLAGKKDARLYEGSDAHNAAYRGAWQQARRDAETRAFNDGSEDITARPAAMPEPASIVPFEPKPGAPKPPANEGWQGATHSTWHFFREGETRSVCKRAHRVSVEASEPGGLTCSLCEARIALKEPEPKTPPADQLALF